MKRSRWLSIVGFTVMIIVTVTPSVATQKKDKGTCIHPEACQ